MPQRICTILLLGLLAAGCAKGPEAASAGAGAPLLIAPEDVRTIRDSAHRLRARRSPARSSPSAAPTCAPRCRPWCCRCSRRTAKRCTTRRPAGAPGRHRDPRQPRARPRRPRARRRRPSTRPSASTQRMKTLRGSGHEPRRRRWKTPRCGATTRRATCEAARTRVVVARASSCSAPRCARRSTAWSATARSRPATPPQVGKELLKVIDPTQHALRRPGLGRPHGRGEGRAGGAASASTATANEEFAGRVRRVNPAANADHAPGGGAGGLRDAHRAAEAWPGCTPKAASRPQQPQALTLPASAAGARRRPGVSPGASKRQPLHKVAPASLGERDARTGDYVVAGGLAEGDHVLRYPS